MNWIGAAAVLAIPLVALAAVYTARPHSLVAPLVSLNRRLSGLSAKVVEVDGHRVHYVEGGEGEAVLLLHGIFAEKDHWVEFARGLTPAYRVIAPDLPGHGASTRLEDEPYTYEAQVRRLHALVEQLGIESFHVAGSSMGGTIAALYALEHPDRVRSVAFIGAPHGIRTPQPSEADDRIAAGEIPLIARSPAEFERMMDLLFARRPFLPRPIVLDAERRAVERAASNVRLWQEQRSQAHLLHAELPRLVHRSLTLWGEEDRVFHRSGAEAVRRMLPGGVVEVLPGVGHLPMMERPRETAARYRRFLDEGS